MNNMISVEAAKKLIRENTSSLAAVSLALKEAAGLVLAEDVFALIDIPAYPQSSMDGYAFCFKDFDKKTLLTISGEMQAGAEADLSILPGQAVRIFTGAAVPSGADTVVMQEKVTVTDGQLQIEDEKLLTGGNVRPKGSEIKSGELALEKGSFLSPAAIGFLAGIGITHVNVYPKPTISIIVTGKELQQPGKELQYGQVYESNSATLTAALQQLHLFSINVFTADDDLQVLTDALQNALDQSTIILLTGGVSVGDYDFVLQAAANCGVEQVFHKLKQRPGKPLYFGTKENKLVFGLPGNPSSVLTCFYEFVIPALGQLSNKDNVLRKLQVPLSKDFQKAPGLTHFLKGWYNGEKVIPLNAQESYRLSSFAKANCLVQIDEHGSFYKEGDLVEIHLLPV